MSVFIANFGRENYVESTKGKHGPVIFFDARKLEIARMAETALTTTESSNGQEVV